MAVRTTAAADVDVTLWKLTRPTCFNFEAMALENVLGGTCKVLLQAQASRDRAPLGTPRSWAT